MQEMIGPATTLTDITVCIMLENAAALAGGMPEGGGIIPPIIRCMAGRSTATEITSEINLVAMDAQA